MSYLAQEQAANVAPPRKSAIIALTVDTTARAYSLQDLDFGGATPDADQSRRFECWITLQAETGAVYYQFAPDNGTTLSETAAVAAGGTLAYANTYGAMIATGDRHEVRLDRSRDLFIVVKAAAGTPILRFWASSQVV